MNTTGTTVAIAAYNNATDRDNLFNQTDAVFPFANGSVRHKVITGLEVGRQTTDNLLLTAYFASLNPTATSVNVPLLNPHITQPLTFRRNANDANNHGVAKTVAL